MAKKLEIASVEVFPGMDVAVPKKETIGIHEAFRLVHGDKLAHAWPSRRYGYVYSTYQIGSVIGYAQENDKDVEEALALASRIGEEKYFIYGLGATITSHKRPKETFIKVEEGDIVRFEGKMFRVNKTWNNNLKLTEV